MFCVENSVGNNGNGTHTQNSLKSRGLSVVRNKTITSIPVFKKEKLGS